MAWPFGNNSGNIRDADAELSEERLKIMANVAIEQVPLPEEGELSEEDAWTISPGPTRAKLNSIGSVPTVASSMNPVAAPATVNAQVDTSGLERLISSRLDMVEDVLRMVEHRLEEGVPVIGELHRLPCAGEQLLADEILEIADPARQRGRAEPEFIGCGACRAETDGAHERLERAQGRKTTGSHDGCTL